MDTLFRRFGRIDEPRYRQIAVLGGLLGYGVLVAGLGIALHVAVAIPGTAQLLQYLASRCTGPPRFDPLSALITALSLALPLLTDDRP
jgi:hypothetical protein